ncbi:MAG: hypothetical protein H7123_02695 [Thermoleophilia bacterium]|nr:hypothetical protein [Thermoleophilia bacterium]
MRDRAIVAPVPESTPEQRQQRRVAGGITLLLAIILGVGFLRLDYYPFSTYPMYSEMRLDPLVVKKFTVRVTDDQGVETDISSHHVTSRVHAYARKGILATPAGRKSFVDEMQQLGELGHHKWVRVQVFRTSFRVPSAPQKPFPLKQGHSRPIIDSQLVRGEATGVA